MTSPSPASSPSRRNLAFLAGAGEMASRIRELNWAATSLGPPETWPASLRTSVRMALSTGHPTLVMWGEDLICVYNDAFKASLGPEKHPSILGLSGRQAWRETWPLIGAQLESVLAGGPPVWHENVLVPIERHGRLDDVYWTYSYSGIEDESASNHTGGVLVLCHETTSQVLERQRVNSELASMAQLFEQAPLFMAVLSGSSHRFEFVNPAYRRLIAGRDVDGRTVAEALPEVVGQGFIDLLDSVYRTGKPYIAHAASIQLLSEESGKVEDRRLDFVYQPTLDNEGRVTGVFVAGVDVTERIQTETALALREEQLRLATEASDIGLWDVDPIADTLYWPPSVRRMFGIFSDREVTMREDFYEGLHVDDREATSKAYAGAIDPAVRSTYDVEYRTVGREDGVVRWIAAKGRGVFDRHGRCIRVIGTARNITEQKRDEAKLRDLNETLERRLSEHLAERKLFADVVDDTDALIQVFDTELSILAINKAAIDEFHRLYGVRPKVGDNMSKLLSDLGSQRAQVELAWSKALRGESFVETTELGDEKWDRCWYELHYQPLYSSSGKLLGAFQFGYDITARRAAEARLAEAESALQQAQRMEAIGLLTGGVAHDFNNVLQAVNTKFELIRRKPDNPTLVREWAASGVDVARRGARVTAQLLAFSRRQEQANGPVGVKTLLANIGDLLRTTLGARAELCIDCDELWVDADSTQLEMALLNLVVNARDAMAASGKVTISVACAKHSDFVDIAVSDTGCGMSADLISKAFTPFYSTKEIGKGTGLGLAQVYAMATRADGSARIESDGISGTTVVISLPRAEPVGNVEPGTPAAVETTEAGPMSVLVVDDDAEVRVSLVELLRGLGHHTIEASRGEDALTLLEDNAVDTLLCDFAMPGMSGVTVAHLARASRPGLKVVFMSGYADADELRDALGQNATLLRKPFDVAAVQRALASAVRQPATQFS